VLVHHGRMTGQWMTSEATIPPMTANTPGRRLKVLACGLHQLGARCVSEAEALSAIATRSLGTGSAWQANAGAVEVASACSRKDLARLVARMSMSGTKYAKAGANYLRNDEDCATELRGLVP
jgi:hypothetical protein